MLLNFHKTLVGVWGLLGREMGDYERLKEQLPRRERLSFGGMWINTRPGSNFIAEQCRVIDCSASVTVPCHLE